MQPLNQHTNYDHTSSYHLGRVTGHKGQVKESKETTLTQFSIQIFPNPQLILCRRAHEGSASICDGGLFLPHSRECSSRRGYFSLSKVIQFGSIELGSYSHNCLSHVTKMRKKSHKNVETFAMYLSDSNSYHIFHLSINSFFMHSVE